MPLRTAISFVAASAFLLPFAASAQAPAPQDDLHAAIWASVLTDPRAANIPPAQMTVLVDDLATQASAQHMTASDILSRPGEASTLSASAASGATSACGAGLSGYLCNVNKSLGFGGDDMLVPALLFGSSGLLLVVIRRMRINHRATLAALAAAAAPPPWPPPQA
ncbi:hypothetical protein HY968_02015 [Candidatus Kaiserbacteria bacterium]|nr:hypothetical protein [Candidatus Kaiserbacteria bacterium]